MEDKIFIAIWKDRHSDTTAHPFTDKKRAIEWSRNKAKESCRHGEGYNEYEVDGWEFHVEYSCESDCIYVVESAMNQSDD